MTEIETQNTTAGPVNPALESLLGTFVDDYKAGRLPREIQDRLDDARQTLEKNIADHAHDAVERVTDWVGDFKATVVDVAVQWAEQHPELAGVSGDSSAETAINALEKVDAQTLTPEDVVSMRDMLHAAIDVAPIMIDFVQDVVHDMTDAVHEVIDIKASTDPSGALDAKADNAHEELNLIVDEFDGSMDQKREQIGRAHDEIDEAMDFIEANPAEAAAAFKTHRLETSEANVVQPDSEVIGEAATA